MFDIISSNPLRIKIPFVLDVVMVSEPEQIKQIEASGDVDRLHVYDTKSLPWWVKSYFRATKFHDAARDLWFCPFESSSNPTYQPRLNYLKSKLESGYTEADVKTIAQLLQQDADDESLSQAMVQVVNRRFFDQEIPLSITQSAKHTVQEISEAIQPWQYSKGEKAQEQIMNYCEQNLPPDVHILDVGHNIGEVVQATTGALRKLKANLDKSVEEIFTTHPPTPQSPRIAVEKSTFNGLLSSPTTPGTTVVIYKVGSAATKSQDILFTFGAGSEERVCVFKEFFLQFMRDLQRELTQN